MSISALFAPRKQQADPNEKLLGEIERLRLERDVKSRVADELGKLNQKLRADIDRLRHQRSGTYNFRLQEVQELAKAVALIEQGDAYGIRLLCGVMEDLRPDWRSL